MPNTPTRPDASSFLNQSNASSDGIDEKWAANNEQWWDWYLSLAQDDGQGPGPEVAMPPLPELSPPSMPELMEEHDSAYALPPEAIEFFRREGFVKLKQVCSPASLLLLRGALDELFAKALGDTPAMRFPSLEMMWTIDPVARAFVLSQPTRPHCRGASRRRFGSPLSRQRPLEADGLWPHALALRCPPLPDRFGERGHGLDPFAANA